MRMTILDKAEAAMKKAVKKVVDEHRKTGRLLVIWRNGKVVKISAKNIK